MDPSCVSIIMLMMSFWMTIVVILSCRSECFVSRTVIDVLTVVGGLDVIDFVGLLVAAAKLSPNLSSWLNIRILFCSTCFIIDLWAATCLSVILL